MKLLALLLVSGCVTAPIILPDGTQGYAVECVNSIAACYKKASKLCPSGYYILESDKNGSTAEKKNEKPAIDPNVNIAQTKVNITQLIRCKDIPTH